MKIRKKMVLKVLFLFIKLLVVIGGTYLLTIYNLKVEPVAKTDSGELIKVNNKILYYYEY